VPFTGGPGQTLGVNAVGCSFNTGSICTPTQAIVVQHDIDVNGVTPTNVDTNTNAAITCLANGGALDNQAPGSECEDLGVGTGANGTMITAAHAAQLCRTALTDALNTGCSSTASNICFCGSAPLNGTCKTGGANGVAECTQAAAAYQLTSAGPPPVVSSPAAVVGALGQPGVAVGVVDILLNNAGPSNANCPTLLTPDSKGPAVTCAL
jgi:hypothetical protein